MIDHVNLYLISLWSLTNEMAPYLLLGFLFAGILKVTIPPAILTRYLGKSSTKSVINASFLGVPLPLCSCGVLPAGISLYKNGASKGSSVSFLISTPQTGVDSILVTWSMLGLPLAIIRPIVAFITGIFGGIVTNKLDKEKIETRIKKQETSKTRFSLKELFRYAFVEMIDEIGKWLVIGLLIAALLTVIIPDNFFTEMNITGIQGMILLLVVSIPLYICATASVPIAAVLLLKGLSPGAILVFLMAGPATNAATMTVIGKNLGKKTLIIYLSSLIIGALGFGLIIDTFLPASWFNISTILEGHNHEIIPHWISVLLSIILVILLLFSFGKKIDIYLRTRINRRKMENENKLVKLIIGVEEMSCKKCTAKVENGLMAEFTISEIKADNENNTVSITGTNLDESLISKKIFDLGYKFTGVIKRDQE